MNRREFVTGLGIVAAAPFAVLAGDTEPTTGLPTDRTHTGSDDSPTDATDTALGHWHRLLTVAVRGGNPFVAFYPETSGIIAADFGGFRVEDRLPELLWEPLLKIYRLLSFLTTQTGLVGTAAEWNRGLKIRFHPGTTEREVRLLINTARDVLRSARFATQIARQEHMCVSGQPA